MIDFTPDEFARRTQGAQKSMARLGLDALFFTTEAEIRYFTGFRTLFWQSPTRPWFLIIPAASDPIAVIPAIGADLMARTWLRDIRTWPAPNPDDDGVSLLLDALKGCRRIGMPMAAEASLRMPLLDFYRLNDGLSGEFVDASPLMRALRMVKSAAEIEVLQAICACGSAAFAQAPNLFHQGQTLKAAFQTFRIALLNAGAEEVPYLVGGAGQDGYGDVISPPDATRLRAGDVLMLDTGATLKGYFCDFDRNFAIGHATRVAQSAYRRLWAATEAGLAAARPGATCAELFAAMALELPKGGSAVGRFGHGLGMQLTEGVSISPHDRTILQPGMVITLEPSMEVTPGRMMVHEENILVTQDKPVLLSERAAPDLPVI